jgi:hypothetical protein
MNQVVARRTSVFVVAMALLAGLAVVGAPAALAHHPEIAVTTSCDPSTGGPVLSVTANSWSFVPTDAGNHDDVRIQMRRLKADGTWTGWLHEIGNGAFLPGNRSFVRTFDAGSVMADFGTLGSMVGQTVQVRLHVEDTVDDEPEDLRAGWYDDAGQYPETGSGNGNPLAFSGQFVIPGGCQPTPVGVGVSGSCTTGEVGSAEGSITVLIAPDSGATVTVNGQEYTTSQVIALPPGSYPWSALAAAGHVLVGDASGTAVIEDCSQPTSTTTTTTTSTTSTTTSTTVAAQNVAITMSCPAPGSSVPQATVVPAGGASVELLAVGNGVFTWRARSNPGFTISGASSGVFDTTPCAKVLGEVITTSTTTSTTIAAVAADQLPFTGFALARTLLLAAATLGAGIGLLAMAARRNDEAPEVVIEHWSD